jgi:hypothetical protein
VGEPGFALSGLTQVHEANGISHETSPLATSPPSPREPIGGPEKGFLAGSQPPVREGLIQTQGTDCFENDLLVEGENRIVLLDVQTCDVHLRCMLKDTFEADAALFSGGRISRSLNDHSLCASRDERREYLAAPHIPFMLEVQSLLAGQEKVAQ